MERSAIYHRSALTDCYALDRDTVVLNLRTGKEITAVTVVHGDPYVTGSSGKIPWCGMAVSMTMVRELANCLIWTVELTPPYKREQYYFEITDGRETVQLYEDGLYTREQAQRPGRLKQYFKFPWLNESDVCTPPAWVAGTVWYQIFPDRFRRGSQTPKRMALRPWNDVEGITHRDFFGGDLPGITEKLEYLRDLGVTGVYLTPIFESDTNHRYNTFDYTKINPDLGTEKDWKVLIAKAHSLGMRVMMDAVFNHSGTGFGPWQDVLEKGRSSAYWDWFFVQDESALSRNGDTRDGRYFTFAFERRMPKLNTNNPEVAEYFIRRCEAWIRDWDVDGIRFDVGNEVAHGFLKQARRRLKAVKPDLFLLGEIWHDSVQWLQGDEYDSVMNYPLLESLQNFWVDREATSREFMYAVNRCLSLYPEQVNRVLFNFLDTHDTPRARTRCGSDDVLWQQLTALMTMPGSPCLYYGTEIAMEGGFDPDNRRPMPWDRVEAGECDGALAETRQIIALRKHCDGNLTWFHDEAHPRLVSYATGQIRVYLNSGDAVAIATDQIIYARNYEAGKLLPNGILVVENLGA